MSALGRSARRRIRAVAWRQWLTVLIGAAVVAAMVLVAETARRDAERHLKAQVLVERIRAEGQAVGALDWQALAITTDGDTPRTVAVAGLVQTGLTKWTSLSAAIAALQSTQPGATATLLQREARGLYTAGRHTLGMYLTGDVKSALALNERTVQPQLSRFDADAEQAAANQAHVAASAVCRRSP